MIELVGDAMTANRAQRPVIAGVDGSEVSVRAARLAAAAARRRAAPLHLLHASLGVTDLLGTRADAVLRKVADSLAGTDRDVEVSWSMEQGDPADVLRAVSAAAQLLVLGGGRRAGRVGGPSIGSTAKGVAASARCPVVVVPDTTTSIVVRGRRSVVVGVEGRRGEDAEEDRGTEEVLGFAFREASIRRTDLVAVHAWRDLPVTTEYESEGPLVDWAAVRSDEERVLSTALAGWQQRWPDVLVREVIVRDRTAHGLLAAALTAELLVVGHRRRGPIATMRSTTRAVLHRATGPVAVVPIEPP
ncbi:universal stress protein [Geodermatophilus sabuli]|uniref:Universal stress protein family protein n=1 Tax=Geodermatophilus sabuli TaxID=1564158 RepID=A0A285EAA0_9ACTN|nr:universal stress protein [Geodermatophilus sabuli]MBB3085664.1 nucleotide-binding universal stress UspA family protein [Geodermatophilus sabuli]SNX95917.1 Universal stress protein family protein [Geodermatophilus sabuli]